VKTGIERHVSVKGFAVCVASC